MKAYVCVVAILLCMLCSPARADDEPMVIRNKNTGNDITITFNDQGVPFVSAPSEDDLFYGQGYIVARNRLWQIEFWRRLMAGTLSEIYGNATFALDLSQRQMQWVQVCNQNIANTPQSYLDNVITYSAGVNAFIDECKSNSSLLPPEFAEYDAPFPAPYAPVDTYLLMKGVSMGLANNAGSEIANEQQLESMGEKRFLLLNSRDPRQPTIMPPYKHSTYESAIKYNEKHGSSPRSIHRLTKKQQEQKQVHQVHDDTLHLQKELANVDFEALGMVMPFFDEAARKVDASTKFSDNQSSLKRMLSILKLGEMVYASNNWAVSGEHTDTGSPILSSDPHLPYLAPSIWVLVGLNCTAPSSKLREMFGVTIIGGPGVAIGRGPTMAWGITTNKADSQDMFKMNNTADNRAYYYKGEVVPYDVRKETINVKGVGNISESFLWSVYGPVTNDNDRFYSLKWAALGPIDTSIEGLYDSNVAQNIDEWREAMLKYWGLLFNVAFADVHGNIAMQVTGKIPIRSGQSLGLVPQPGDGFHDWLSFIPPHDMPFTQNPPQGFVVSANNRPDTPSRLTDPMPGEYAPGFRAQRIIDRIMDAISSNTPITVELNEDIQVDCLSYELDYMRPALENLQLSGDADDRRQQILSWDADETLSSKEASTFEAWTRCLWNVTFYELGASRESPYLAAAWFNQATPDGSGDYPVCAPWGMTCLEYASQCFENVTKVYKARRYSLDHIGMFVHLPPFPLKWNRFTPVGGDHYTPNSALFTLSVPDVSQALVVGGPSVRFVCDLSETTPSQWVLPAGESGVPDSPHYDDQLDTWADYKYYDMGW